MTTHQVLQKGWALKVPKRATRFPDNVRNYLQEKFDLGNATGHKADPVQVCIDMRCARDELGRRLFAASECLQTQQIRSFFSRLAAAQRKNVQSPADLIEDEVRDLESDTQAEQYETELQELREGIIAEVAEKHPICYERFNLGELSQQNKLKKFNIGMLVRICEHFELDIATVSRNRKEGFITQIKELIGSCSCSMYLFQLNLLTKVDFYYIETLLYASEARKRFEKSEKKKMVRDYITCQLDSAEI